MLVILEAVAGPIAGRLIEIRAGDALRLGRTAKSDYPIGEDPYLSGQHFSIECDGVQCRVRDLGSSNGTFLNGDRITEHLVQNGDSLVAGGSTFTLHVDTSVQPVPPPIPGTNTGLVPTVRLAVGVDGAPMKGVREPPLPWPGFSRSQSKLLTTLYRAKETVFAVVDPSRDARISALLNASGERFAAIGDGRRPSPYLVELPPSSQLLEVLIKDGWAHSWGFYCTALSGFEEARRHWSMFLALHNELGQTLTFRFWDPRVLRALVPLMSPQESVDFFGPILRMVVESEDPGTALEFSLTARGPKQESMLLA